MIIVTESAASLKTFIAKTSLHELAQAFVLRRKYSPKAWSDGRSGRDGISFRFHPGRRTVGEVMRVDPLSYEELERSGSAAFCS